MADLPLEPTLARMLLAAGEMGCTAEVLTVVAMLSVQSVWAGGGRREVDEAKARCGASGLFATRQPFHSSQAAVPPPHPSGKFSLASSEA
jgi:HrpA-like RNA helicase